MRSRSSQAAGRFPAIGYLQWAKQRPHPIERDLSMSGLEPPPLGRLPLDPGSLPLGISLHDAARPLVEALAVRFGVSEGTVLPVLGTTMAVYVACGAILRAGDRVLVEKPTYEPLLRIPASFGARIEALDRSFERGFHLDLDALERQTRRPPALLILSNLHNPSGVELSAKELALVAGLAEERGFWVLMDEVYLEFAWSRRPPPAFALSERILSVGSMTKAYGLGGIRLGWILAPPEIRTRAEQITDYISSQVAAPSIAIALAALRNIDALVEPWRERIAENLLGLEAWVEARDEVRWVRPDGGIAALVRLAGLASTLSFCEDLERTRATRVVPGEFFELPGCVRIGFGVEGAVLHDGLARLAEAMGAWRERVAEGTEEP